MKKANLKQIILNSTAFCSLVLLHACNGVNLGGGGVDALRAKSGGTQIARNTDPSDCSRVTSHAQNIFIEWGRERKQDGAAVSASTVSALMGLGRYETGGSKGVNFANITLHGNESVTNKEGWNGSSFGSVAKVESFLDRYNASTETNFCGLQISPNVVVNYGQEGYFQSFVNRFNSPSELYTSCLTDMAYGDKSKALSELSDLHSQRDQIGGWLHEIKQHTAKSQKNCKNDPACVKASENIGRWLSYCPRLCMDMGAVVWNRAPHYFGARSRYPGRDPRVCTDMVAKELNKPYFNVNGEAERALASEGAHSEFKANGI